MCAGAMINAKLGRLVYGCHDPKYGAAGSALQLLDFPDMLHKVPVTAGVLEEECLSVIQAFFQQRRQEAKQKKVNQWGEN
jgi:tRNA(adenine34) deaminase